MYLDTRNHQHLKLVMFCRPGVDKNLLFPRTSSRRYVDEHSKMLNIQQFFFRMLIWRWSQASVFLSQNLRRGGSLPPPCPISERNRYSQKYCRSCPSQWINRNQAAITFTGKCGWNLQEHNFSEMHSVWTLLACFLFWKIRLQDSWEAFH